MHGLLVGHAQDREAQTGCTVLIGPFRAAVDIRGMATGTRELDALSPLHIVETIDAVVLTGGSAFGLAAADGVMSWLAENGRGFDTGFARIPIVPAAVIFDLGAGRPDVRPDAAMGRAACEDAFEARADIHRTGRIGAGCGATAGKLLGPSNASRTGLGTATLKVGEHTILAFAVVNPIGDVLDAHGRIIAGVRVPGEPHKFADSRALLMETPTGAFAPAAGTNTTLVAVVTDAPLSRIDLERMARVASTGVARRIAPVNTPFDGDVVFALSTAPDISSITAATMLALGSGAATVVERAIEAAVTHSDNES